jgi:hypothetical protein
LSRQTDRSDSPSKPAASVINSEPARPASTPSSAVVP